MKRLIDVHSGEVIAGQGEVVLKSDTTSPCLVFTAYDSVHKIGCLAHALFLSGPSKEIESTFLKDASHAIDEMISDMTLLGARKDDIEVCLLTGENVSHKDEDMIYSHNIASAVDLLKQKRVKLKRNAPSDVGRSHVVLDVESGSISYA